MVVISLSALVTDACPGKFSSLANRPCCADVHICLCWCLHLLASAIHTMPPHTIPPALMITSQSNGCAAVVQESAPRVESERWLGSHGGLRTRWAVGACSVIDHAWECTPKVTLIWWSSTTSTWGWGYVHRCHTRAKCNWSDIHRMEWKN